MEPPDPIFIIDPDIKDFWSNIISKNYPDFYEDEKPKIDDWHSAYVILMKDATTAWARDLTSQAYRRTNEIRDKDKAQYYLSIILPDKSMGKSYRNDVFNKTVGEVTRRLKNFLRAFDDIDAYSNLKNNDLGDWNMDKGTVDDKNPQFALWPPGETEFPFDCPGDPPKING